MGGALFSQQFVKVYVYNSTFLNNAAGAGGTFSGANSFGEFHDSYFNNSLSLVNGGTLQMTSQSGMRLYNCQFGDSLANGGYGGIIYLSGSSNAIISNTSMTGGSAYLAGGAISITEESNLLVDTCDFYSNTAFDGGAVYLEYSSRATIFRTNIYGNNALDAGGGFYCSESKLNITQSQVTENKDQQENGDPNVYCSQYPSGTECTLTGDDANSFGECKGNVFSGNSDQEKEPFPIIAIIGIALGGAGLVLCCITLGVCYNWKRNQKHDGEGVGLQKIKTKIEKDDMELLQDYDD